MVNGSVKANTVMTNLAIQIADALIENVEFKSFREMNRKRYKGYMKQQDARDYTRQRAAPVKKLFERGYRETEAPMRAITKGLPRQPRRDNHFAAMPYEDVPAFVQTFGERDPVSRLALEFAIFTAARSGEVRGATWNEFDLEKGLWTLSKERM